ncbi:uncharacterized protein LOC120329993 [Styela clava]
MKMSVSLMVTTTSLASLAILLDVIALSTTSWLTTSRMMLGITIVTTSGLFQECRMSKCHTLVFSDGRGRAEDLAAASLILPLFILGVGIFFVIGNEFRNVNHGFTGGVLFSTAGLFGLIGVSVYSGLKKQVFVPGHTSSFGYSFVLACGFVVLCLLSSMLAFIGMTRPDTNAVRLRILT